MWKKRKTRRARLNKYLDHLFELIKNTDDFYFVLYLNNKNYRYDQVHAKIIDLNKTNNLKNLGRYILIV